MKPKGRIVFMTWDEWIEQKVIELSQGFVLPKKQAFHLLERLKIMLND